jgi:hypothetical protein
MRIIEDDADVAMSAPLARRVFRRKNLQLVDLYALPPTHARGSSLGCDWTFPFGADGRSECSEPFVMPIVIRLEC